MNIKVRLFALTREIAGKQTFDQDLPQGATLDDFVKHLYASYPAMQPLRLKFAVNMVYAPLDTVLKDADEIACIPPVGGG